MSGQQILRYLKKGVKELKILFNFEVPIEGISKGKWQPETQNGGVAQLGEHLPCTQGVRSSILLISTNGFEVERISRESLSMGS